MKIYRVKALYVGGVNNKIFSCGDIVKEKHFPPGNADLLVKQGFLDEIIPVVAPGTPFSAGEPKVATIPAIVPVAFNPAADPDADVVDNETAKMVENMLSGLQTDQTAGGEQNTPAASDKVPSIDDITKKEIIAALKQMKVDFDQLKSKKELYDLWISYSI